MKTITIKGIGQIALKPDLIVISMKMETIDKEYDKTMEISAKRIDELNKALEEIGFKKESILTTNFHVSTRYESIRDKDGIYKNVFKGYGCIHNLKLEFDFDTKILAKVLSKISLCLAKPELSITFTIKDKTKVNEELLKSATKNAKEKALILSSSSGVTLKDLISINYDFKDISLYSNTEYTVENRCMMQAESYLANVNIEPDDIKINDTITFVWEII
ncbi:MAG: SIMPL domain-containing protein [Bacilli bacterium]|nr:SIMPL domain-containing protein [Acholeplasmataceae bacterium]MDY2902460.1 SIMPL domain-containing protein [Bacilli bacterium]